MTKLTVLLIEDNTADSLLMMQFLTKKDPEVSFVILSDGASALNFLSKLQEMDAPIHPDIIILDLMLPKIAGRDILKFIKSDPKLRLIPVIVFTVVTDEAEIRGAYEDNANCYIIKPSDLEQFEECINMIYAHWFQITRRPLAAARAH